VVGGGLCIGAELVGVAAGPSMAGGGGAHGGTHGGLCGGDLAVEARAGGRWHRLGVREAAWPCLIALGGAVIPGFYVKTKYSSYA
jgi:hypothetical protein